jgi:hypothetical protein
MGPMPYQLRAAVTRSVVLTRHLAMTGLTTTLWPESRVSLVCRHAVNRLGRGRGRPGLVAVATEGGRGRIKPFSHAGRVPRLPARRCACSVASGAIGIYAQDPVLKMAPA